MVQTKAYAPSLNSFKTLELQIITLNEDWSNPHLCKTWGSNTDLNSSSIRIELDNNCFEQFPPSQIASLKHLLKDLKEKYKISAANFIGHSYIAPIRKNDPNKTFSWKALAEEGYGLWYDEIIEGTIQLSDAPPVLSTSIPQELIKLGNDSIDITPRQTPTVPKLLDVPVRVALNIIGYDVSDTPATIKAFKLHFIQTEVNSILTDYDLKVLNNVYRKYL